MPKIIHPEVEEVVWKLSKTGCSQRSIVEQLKEIGVVVSGTYVHCVLKLKGDRRQAKLKGLPYLGKKQPLKVLTSDVLKQVLTSEENSPSRSDLASLVKVSQKTVGSKIQGLKLVNRDVNCGSFEQIQLTEMDVPILTKADLLCLLSRRKTALREAVEIVRPHLKPNLTEKELTMLRFVLAHLKSKFNTMSRSQSVDGKLKKFKEVNAHWLSSTVRVPSCLLHDTVVTITSLKPKTKTANKCGNCQKDLSENVIYDGRKTLEAFQTVFEGLLKLNNVSELSHSLPEICSNCDSLLLTLHKMYVDFMSLTQLQSPIHLLLGHSNASIAKESTAVLTEATPKRKNLNATESCPRKLRKREENKEVDAKIVKKVNSNLPIESGEFVEPVQLVPVIIPSSVKSISSLVSTTAKPKNSGPRIYSHACPHPNCSKVCLGKLALKRHMISHEGLDKSDLPCPHCPTRISGGHWFLKRHIQEVHKYMRKTKTDTTRQQTIESDSAQQITPDPTDLTSETSSFVTHTAGKSCTICGQVIEGRRTLEKHIQSHSVPLLTCPHCETDFRGNYSLQLHLRQMHPDEYRYPEEDERPVADDFTIRDTQLKHPSTTDYAFVKVEVEDNEYGKYYSETGQLDLSTL